MADWPTSLPNFNSGLREQQVDGFVRTPTDIGPGEQRRRYSATPHYFTGTMTLTQTERATFDAFYNTEIGNGGGAFTMTDPSTGQQAEFRFTRAPSWTLTDTADGILHTADLALERLP